MSKLIQRSAEFTELLKKSGSNDPRLASESTHQFAKALELPLRQGVLDGDITGGIFEMVPLEGNASSEFPLSFLAPGTEGDYVAYSIPNHGYIPQKSISGDYVMVPTYEIGNAIDWNLKYARDARWDVVSKAMEVLQAGFTKKVNDDLWAVLLAAGADRNIVVLDSDAGAGQFTKRLVSLGKTVMRRNGGGNTTSLTAGRLTDLYLSVEGLEDIRNWGVDQVDEITRREIFVAEDGKVSRIFGVNLHGLVEFGEGQQFQSFYEDELGGSLPAGDVEIAVGLDLSNRDSFVMPVKSMPEVFSDDSLHRMRRGGLYSWMELGAAVLDNRRALLLSF